ncbi:MAG: DUF2917 domain-containing protein [Luteolibacter sp.]
MPSRTAVPAYLSDMQPLLTQSSLGRWITRGTGKSTASSEPHRLNPRQQLQVKLHAHQRLCCLRGSVWVTLEGEDHVLTTGQSLHLWKKPTRLFIEALQTSAVAIR